MAYGFNNDKTKAQTYKKEEIYTKEEINNNFLKKDNSYTTGEIIEIPRTLSNSDKYATINYIFPSDGYLYIKNTSNVSVDTGGYQSHEIKGQSYLRIYTDNSIHSNINILDSTLCPVWWETLQSDTRPHTCEGNPTLMLFVKKGLRLKARLEFYSAEDQEGYCTLFYPVIES